MQSHAKRNLNSFRLSATLLLTAERQSARMSKIINDGLTRSGTGCFTAIPIMATVGVKGLISQHHQNIPTNDTLSTQYH